MASKKCPVCGVPVKLENLERHVRGQHPREDVDLTAVLTEGERRDARRAAAPARPRTSRRGKLLLVAVALLVAAVLALAILNPFGGVGPGIGQRAPDFSLGTSTEGTVTLSEFRDQGKPVLLEFMDVDCGACQAEAPVLASLYGTYGTRVQFISVSANFVGAADTNDRLNTFKTEHGTPWTYALIAGNLLEAYGVSRTPTTFVIDGRGIVVQAFVGSPVGGLAGYSAALDRALA